MSHDETVPPEEATLQRYFDGTLDPSEAQAFEQRLEADPAMAAKAASYASLFAALELRQSANEVDLVAEAMDRWVTSLDPRAATRFFLGVDFALGALLVGLLGLKGPTELVVAWVIGLKDVALGLQSLLVGPEQGIALALVALGTVLAAVAAVGVGLGRVFLGAGSRA